MKRLQKMRFTSLLILSLLSALCFSEPSQTTGKSTEDKVDFQSSKLSVKAMSIKQSVLELNRDLYQLEKELLSPATTRAALYFSLSHGEYFEPYSIIITIDNKQPIEYLYTTREVRALRQGAVQPLQSLNLGPGVHQIKAVAKGVDINGRNIDLSLEESVDKYDNPLYVEFKIQDNKELKTAELIISQW